MEGNGRKGQGATRDEDRGAQMERQWRLLIALSARHFPAALEELADELRVHARTIRRDLEVLGRVGFVVERVRDPLSRQVKVRIPPALRERNLAFTLGELISLHFASELMQGLAGTPMKAGIDTALRRIEMALPEPALEHVERTRDALRVKPGPAKDYRRHIRTVEAMRQAVAERRVVEVTYRAYGRSRSDRHVFRPYLMTWNEGTLYVIGWSELRAAMRTFAVERVRRIHTKEDRFELPAGWDGDRYLRESFGIWRDAALYPGSGQGREPYAVRIEFDPQAAQRVRERRWHATQKLSPLPGGGLALDMRTVGLEDVLRWVLAFGRLARVTSPPELVQAVAGELRAAAERYGTQAPPAPRH